MSRSSTTFTKGDPRAIAARKRLGLKSATTVQPRSKRELRQISRELQAAGLRVPLRLRRYASQVQAVWDLGCEAIEASGGLIKRGSKGKLVTDGAADFWLRHGHLLAHAYHLLGLTKVPTEPESDLAAILRRKLG